MHGRNRPGAHLSCLCPQLLDLAAELQGKALSAAELLPLGPREGGSEIRESGDCLPRFRRRGRLAPVQRLGPSSPLRRMCRRATGRLPLPAGGRRAVESDGRSVLPAWGRMGRRRRRPWGSLENTDAGLRPALPSVRCECSGRGVGASRPRHAALALQARHLVPKLLHSGQYGLILGHARPTAAAGVGRPGNSPIFLTQLATLCFASLADAGRRRGRSQAPITAAGPVRAACGAGAPSLTPHRAGWQARATPPYFSSLAPTPWPCLPCPLLFSSLSRT